MMPLERLAIAVLIVVAAFLLYWAFTHSALIVLRRRMKSEQASMGLDEFKEGVPAILYFSTPDCVPCRTAQAPAIDSIRAEYGDRIQVIAVNALEQRSVADRWGVLSVPTTFVLDGRARPLHANNGVAPAVKLKRQLHALLDY